MAIPTSNGLAEEFVGGARARSLGILPSDAGVDLEGAERAVRDLLSSLGLDLSDEHLRETPRRVAQAYADLMRPEVFSLTTFPNDGGYEELVVARDIRFNSLCMHHLMPFVGVAHVGYVPADRILGLSKLARIVDMFARGVQVQERMTTQIAGWLTSHLRPRGVGVVVEAEHMCMSLRGVQKPGSRTVTSSMSGCIRDDARTRSEFLGLAGRCGPLPAEEGRWPCG